MNTRRIFWTIAVWSMVTAPFLASAQARLTNPLRFGSIPELIKGILDAVVLIGTPVAALFIIYSGFLFVTARGNEEKLKTAKTALTWTVIGTAVLLGSWVLADVIAGTIEQIRR